MTDPLTRQSLYAQVWAEPMSKVAPRYNLSDRGLAKICAHFNIPVPPRGYWAKLAHGHKVTKPPLPPWTKGEEPRIYLTDEKPPMPRPPAPPVSAEIAFELDSANKVVVPGRSGCASTGVSSCLWGCSVGSQHFRTFGLDTVVLARQSPGAAATNVLVQVVGGLGAVWIGYAVGHRIGL